MSWSTAEERVNKSDQQDGLWVKLANDGDSAVVVFRGEPHVRVAKCLSLVPPDFGNR